MQEKRQVSSVTVVIWVVAGGSYRITAASLEPGTEPKSMDKKKGMRIY